MTTEDRFFAVLHPAATQAVEVRGAKFSASLPIENNKALTASSTIASAPSRATTPSLMATFLSSPATSPNQVAFSDSPNYETASRPFLGSEPGPSPEGFTSLGLFLVVSACILCVFSGLFPLAWFKGLLLVRKMKAWRAARKARSDEEIAMSPVSGAERRRRTTGMSPFSKKERRRVQTKIEAEQRVRDLENMPTAHIPRSEDD